MNNLQGELIAIGGGSMAESDDAMQLMLERVGAKKDGRLAVITVATSDEGEASAKYNSLFRRRGLKHVDTIAVCEREDAIDERSAEKIEAADVIFFTGGDQFNITSLFGGTALHRKLIERHEAGTMVVGTSAGAAMMSGSMIISGDSDAPATLGGVEIAPGMDFVGGTIIDSHFSQRGRQGRLLTAVAHFPHLIGIGIDERTAAVFSNGGFKVIGPGSVTVIDGTGMEYSDIAYRDQGDSIAMFGVKIHVLPAKYGYDLKERMPVKPSEADLRRKEK